MATKKDMIREVAKESHISQPNVKLVWNAFVKYLTGELVAGEKVAIDGFGTFDVADRSERQQKNPVTGEMMTVKAQKVPRFKFGKNMRDAVNGRE